jgi:glycosyltransferase involved in cell wall biosynthesis
MKVLFLHATWHHASEYNVHRLLAESVDPNQVDCYFVWQSATHNPSLNKPPRLFRANRTQFWDFGRNMALQPKPSRTVRMAMMAKQLPATLHFLRQQIETIQPDVIYTSQQYYEVFLGHTLSKMTGVPHLVHVMYAVGDWLGKQTVRWMQDTPHLIACSDFVREGAINAGISPANIETLHHGADLRQFDIERNPHYVRDLFGWSLHNPIITTAARLDPRKGHMPLLEAFVHVHRVMPNVRLLICGESHSVIGYDEEIKKRVIALGLTDAVVFAGHRRDLAGIFAGTDIFCLPTELDALPLVYLMAMAASVPCVGSLSGGVSEMVTHGENGLLSPVGDGTALAKNLLTLLRNPNLAQAMGANGKQRAMTQFEPHVIAKQWSHILRRRLENRQPETIPTPPRLPHHTPLHVKSP